MIKAVLLVNIRINRPSERLLCTAIGRRCATLQRCHASGFIPYFKVPQTVKSLYKIISCDALVPTVLRLVFYWFPNVKNFSIVYGSFSITHKSAALKLSKLRTFLIFFTTSRRPKSSVTRVKRVTTLLMWLRQTKHLKPMQNAEVPNKHLHRRFKNHQNRLQIHIHPLDASSEEHHDDAPVCSSVEGVLSFLETP